MTLTLTQHFLMSLEPERDRLYGIALAAAQTPAAAEASLLQKSRELFAQYERDSLLNPAGGLAAALAATSPPPVENAPAQVTPTPMPADVWARLAAAVQVEAAHSSNTRALNPDSVLLRPDPLLAPRKSTPKRDADDFDLTNPARLFAGGFIVLLIGVIATVYILTRPAPPAADAGPSPANTAASQQGATQ